MKARTSPLNATAINAIIYVLLAVLLIVGFTVNPFPDWFSFGLGAAGIFGAGLFSVGVFAAGLYSVGIVASGVFSVGIFAFGTYPVGIWASGQFPTGLFTRKIQ